jgi:hypothetical protein
MNSNHREESEPAAGLLGTKGPEAGAAQHAAAPPGTAAARQQPGSTPTTAAAAPWTKPSTTAASQVTGADGQMDINPFTLAFRSPAAEGQYLGGVAKQRWPVLVFVFLFDCVTFTFRFAAKLAGGGSNAAGAGRQEVSSSQICKTAACLPGHFSHHPVPPCRCTASSPGGAA